MMNCYCGEPIKAKSLCQKHYLKDYRERKAAGQIKEKTTLIFDEAIDLWHCKVTGCDDKPRAKQLCTKHYFQVRREEAKDTCCPFCEGKCMNCGANSNHTNLCDNCQASARRIY
jgi:hypothetical protein